MKIISKRRAMTIYRQHPASRIFDAPADTRHGSVCHYTGKVVPDIPGVLAYTPNAARTATGPMPV